MGRSKEQFIDAFGGLEFGEIEAGGSPRIRRIIKLEKKLCSGIPLEQVEVVVDQLRKLQGLPSDEFDYDPRD
jgi:hypothetical protein